MKTKVQQTTPVCLHSEKDVKKRVKEIIENCLPNEDDSYCEDCNGWSNAISEFKSNLKEKYKIKI